MKLILLTALTLATLISPLRAFAENSCQILFNGKPNTAISRNVDPLLHVDLMEWRYKEIEGLTPEQIAELNSKTIREIEATKPPASSSRVKSVSKKTVGLIIQSMAKNKIIADAMAGKYDQPDVSIGYCFGRAAYVHLALLKMGVDKDAIKKVWAVGPMRGTDGIDWQFHVATIVRGNDGHWYAADNLLEGRIATAQEWFTTFAKENHTGDLRLYATDPRKFSAQPSELLRGETTEISGGYLRNDLGLDYNPTKDWYRGFFTNLMGWFRTGNLESVGLHKLNGEQNVEPTRARPKKLLPEKVR